MGIQQSLFYGPTSKWTASKIYVNTNDIVPPANSIGDVIVTVAMGKYNSPTSITSFGTNFGFQKINSKRQDTRTITVIAHPSSYGANWQQDKVFNNVESAVTIYFRYSGTRIQENLPIDQRVAQSNKSSNPSHGNASSNFFKDSLAVLAVMNLSGTSSNQPIPPVGSEFLVNCKSPVGDRRLYVGISFNPVAESRAWGEWTNLGTTAPIDWATTVTQLDPR